MIISVFRIELIAYDTLRLFANTVQPNNIGVTLYPLVQGDVTILSLMNIDDM
jgi:hypothetical protein